MFIPTVFLPGLLCDATLWRAPVDGLADIVAPMIADLTLDDSIAAMAERTLAAAPPRFTLIALSMGGYVAFEMVRRAPQRIERLALIDTSAAPDSPARAQSRRANIESLQLGRFHGVTNKFLPQLLHHANLDGPIADAVKAMAARVGSAAFLRQQRAILGRPDSRPTLSGIAVPTLVGVGDADILTPLSDSEEILRAIPMAVLHVFARCGHLPPLEKPEETTQVLKAWLIGGI